MQLTSPLAAIAVFSLVALIAVRLTLPRALYGQPIDGKAWRAVFSSRLILILLAVTLAQSLGQFIVLTYIAPVLHGAVGATSALLGLMFAVYGVAGMIGNVIGGRLIDRSGSAPAVHLMIVVVGIARALFPFAGLGLPAAFLLMALWGFGAFAINGAQQPRLIATQPALATATLPLNSSAIYVGQAIGAAAGGVLLAHVGMEALAPIGAVSLGVALLLSLAAQRAERRTAAQAA